MEAPPGKQKVDPLQELRGTIAVSRDCVHGCRRVHAGIASRISRYVLLVRCVRGRLYGRTYGALRKRGVRMTPHRHEYLGNTILSVMAHLERYFHTHFQK